MVVDARMNSVCLRWLQQSTRSLGGCQLSVRAHHLRPSFPLALLALQLLLIRQVRSPPVISHLPFWLFLCPLPYLPLPPFRIFLLRLSVSSSFRFSLLKGLDPCSVLNSSLSCRWMQYETVVPDQDAEQQAIPATDMIRKIDPLGDRRRHLCRQASDGLSPYYSSFDEPRRPSPSSVPLPTSSTKSIIIKPTTFEWELSRPRSTPSLPTSALARPTPRPTRTDS
jgi:hypothetical protein